MSQGPCIYQHCHCHVAESGHQRATGGPPEHDSGASKGGGRDARAHVRVGTAEATVEAAILRLLQEVRRGRARGAYKMREHEDYSRNRL